MDLLEERRQKATAQMTIHRNTMARYYNKKVKERRFKVGDLVLKEITLVTKDPTDGKLGPK